MKEKQDIKLPDTSEAEEWLTPDIFKCKGKFYIVLPNGDKEEVLNYRVINKKGVKRG